MNTREGFKLIGLNIWQIHVTYQTQNTFGPPQTKLQLANVTGVVPKRYQSIEFFLPIEVEHITKQKKHKQKKQKKK